MDLITGSTVALSSEVVHVGRVVNGCVLCTNSLRVWSALEVFDVSRSMLRCLRVCPACCYQRLDQVQIVGLITSLDTSLRLLLVLKRKGQLRHKLRLRLALACQLALCRLYEIDSFAATTCAFRCLITGSKQSLRTSPAHVAIEDLAWAPLVVSARPCQ